MRYTQLSLCLLMHCSAILAEPLTLSIRGYEVRQPVFSLFAYPGESIRIGHDGALLTLNSSHPSLASVDETGLVIQAPDASGLYTLGVRSKDPANATTLNLWVGIPRSRMQGEYLNGYRIGSYPSARGDRPNYKPPVVFIEVTADNVDTYLSPHFTMRQFLCKQDSSYPKYVALQESLLVLLEGLLVDVQQAGYEVDTFGVISGYRTPWYNRRIGNVPYSRHIYGDAMDIFIDADADGRMDDLNSDGLHDRADIQKLFDIADKFMRRPENRGLIGGVGKYGRTSRHGGFVHVDTRGYQARW